jgi:tryptophan synthase alpha chain
MNRLDTLFSGLKDRGERALVCILPFGDPDLKTSFELAQLYVDCGVDIFEIVLPIESPPPEETAIPASVRRAITAEPRLEKYFEALAHIREIHPDVPIEVAAYTETIRSLGAIQFAETLAKAGIDAHLPTGSEAQADDFLSELDEALKSVGVYHIQFIPHPFEDAHLAKITKKAKGFVILQSYAQEDGSRPYIAQENKDIIQHIQATALKTPILLAYGIRSGDMGKKAIAMGVDGILVGTAVLQMAHHGSREDLTSLLVSLKSATLPD